MSQPTRVCPFCAEVVAPADVHCPHCDEELSASCGQDRIKSRDEPAQFSRPDLVLTVLPADAPYCGETFRKLYRWFEVCQRWWTFLVLAAVVPAILSFTIESVRRYPDRQLVFWGMAYVSFMLSVVPNLCGIVLFYVFLYKAWSQIQDGHSRTTAMMAVGLSFVLCFNLYWYFVAVRGLMVDMNAYIRRHRLSARTTSVGLGLMYCIGMVACTVLPINPLMMLVRMFILRSLKNSAADIAEEQADQPQQRAGFRFPWSGVALTAACAVSVGGITLLAWLFWPAHAAQAVSLPGDDVNYLALSPDGTSLVTADVYRGANGQFQLWDITGFPERSAPDRSRLAWQGRQRYVNSATFSRDGKLVAAVVQDFQYAYEATYPGELIVADVASGRELLRIGGRNSSGAVQCAAFSPDASTIAAGTINPDLSGSIVIYDVQSGDKLKVLAGHPQAVLCLAFSPDGQHLVSGGLDGTTRLWNADTGNQIATFLDSGSCGVLCAAYSPDGSRFAICDGFKVKIRSDKAWNALPIQLSGKRIEGLAFSPDGRYLATNELTEDLVVNIWGVSTGAKISTLRLFNVLDPSILNVAMTGTNNNNLITFSSDGRKLIAGLGGKLLSWEVDLP
jgi:hypothetical protein